MGFMYLVVIIEWYSRLIVGWAMGNTMQSDFVIRAIEEAIRTHGKHEIINSDQGSQFTSKAYIACIKSKETIRISMNGKNRARDNARIERFFRNYKWERLYPEAPQTVSELKQMTNKYMKHYNWNRPHQSLEDATPGSLYYAQKYIYLSTSLKL
jgi:putative transposase